MAIGAIESHATANVFIFINRLEWLSAGCRGVCTERKNTKVGKEFLIEFYVFNGII